MTVKRDIGKESQEDVAPAVAPSVDEANWLVPDKNGTVRVAADQDTVASYVRAREEAERLEASLDVHKNVWRGLAMAALAKARGIVKRVILVGGPNTVQVSMPDITKDGNRLALEEEAVLTLKASGLDLVALGFVVEQKTYSLTGKEWIEWIEKVIEGMKSAGMKLAEGLMLESTMRLTAAGITALREMLQTLPPTDARRPLISAMLNGGIKSPTVQ